MALTYTNIDAAKQEAILRGEKSYIAMLEKQVSITTDLQKAQKAFEEGLDKRRIHLDKINEITSEIRDIEKEANKRRRSLTPAEKATIDNLRTCRGLEKQALTNLNSRTEQLREQVELEKKIEARWAVGKEMMKSISALAGEAGGKIFAMGENIGKAVKSGDGLLIAFTILSESLKIGVDRFVQLAAAGEKFRIDTGVTLDQSVGLTAHAEALNKQYQKMGVSAGVAYSATAGLIDEVGSPRAVDNMGKMVEASALLTANFGVASKDSSGFLFKMQTIGHLTDKSAAGMASVAISTAKAYGVPLSKMMKGVAEASGETMTMVRGSVVELIKAAAQSRLLGVNLNDAGKSARQFLNFNESINDEMEASVLTGKNLSFQLARQYAWQGKIAESQAEALKVVDSSGDFTKMNAFQQEAVAKAAGYTVEQLYKMVKNREMLQHIQAGTANAEEKQLYMQQQMQSSVTNLNNAWQQVVNTVGDAFGPTLEIIAGMLTGLANGINWLVEKIGKFGTVALVTIVGIGAAMLAGFLTFKMFGNFLEKFLGNAIEKTLGGIGKGLKKLGAGMKSFGSSVSAGDIAKGLLALIGLAAATWLLGKAFQQFGGVDWAGVGKGILAIGALAIMAGIMGAGPIPVWIGIGIGLLAALGIVMLEFSVGALIAAVAFKMVADSIVPMANGIKQLTDIGYTKLAETAAGLGLLSLAFAAFGAGSLIGGIGNFFGGSIFTNIDKMANLGDGLTITADALASIAQSMVIISGAKIDTSGLSALGNVGTTSTVVNTSSKSNIDSQQATTNALNKIADALNNGVKIDFDGKLLKLKKQLALNNDNTIAPVRT